jgi:hypothetical protein
MIAKNMIGQTFGYITVMERLGSSKVGKALWKGICKCGNTIIVSGVVLRNGHTKSCGCLQPETARKFHTRHGFSVSDSKIERAFFSLWCDMVRRCTDPRRKEYRHYGGRGIKVCERWAKFENFRDDMWPEYFRRVIAGEKISIDRIEVNGNYEPSNCKWSFHKDQVRNTRVSSKSENYDLHQKNRKRLSQYLSNAIRHNLKHSWIERYLGCSMPEFYAYIESLWYDGMTWQNRGQGKGKWEIDHIVGCNNFDLSKEDDLLKCFNYLNLRPIWYLDHRKKSTLRVECLPVANS